MLRLVSWNVNSVRVRLESLRRFVRKVRPDVLALQEIKAREGDFPREAFERMGFVDTVVVGQKGYHGVAVASRTPFVSHRREAIGGNPDARHVAVELACGIELHNIYVPAGGPLPDPERNPAFARKLAFLRDAARWMDRWSQGKRRLLVGDFNVAPLEHDVWCHEKMRRVITHTEIEIEHLDRLRRAHDWVDVPRRFVPPDQKLFTWWSYRAPNWRQVNKGRRLDHVWASRSLAGDMVDVRVAREVRGWKRPSDHAPLVIDIAT